MSMNKYEVISEFAGHSLPICHYPTMEEAQEAAVRMKVSFPHENYRIAEFFVTNPKTGSMRYTGRVVHVEVRFVEDQ